jgi:hypothetical protein
MFRFITASRSVGIKLNLKCLTIFSVYSVIEDTYYDLHIMMHFNFTLYIKHISTIAINFWIQ